MLKSQRAFRPLRVDLGACLCKFKCFTVIRQGRLSVVFLHVHIPAIAMAFRYVEKRLRIPGRSGSQGLSKFQSHAIEFASSLDVAAAKMEIADSAIYARQISLMQRALRIRGKMRY